MIFAIGGPHKRPFLSANHILPGGLPVNRDARDPTVETSYDELTVPDSLRGLNDSDNAVEKNMSTTARMGRSLKENKIIVGACILGLAFLGGQFVVSHDVATTQPLVDQHQDFQIQQNAKNYEKMDIKLDSILLEIRAMARGKHHDL